MYKSKNAPLEDKDMFKILIVEDEPKLREILCDYFLCKGEEPYEAENGLRALELVEEIEFDYLEIHVIEE